jgi:predicted transcriptional regulator
VLSNPAKAKRHVDMTHLGHLDKSPPCMLCGKRFKNIETLKQHLRKTHNIFQAQYERLYDPNFPE